MLSPRELYRFGFIRAAQDVEDLRLNRGSVAVVGVIRQVLFRQFCQQHAPHLRIERREMKEGGVIEPDRFAGYRMLCNGGAALPDAQPFARKPLALNPMLPAITADL